MRGLDTEERKMFSLILLIAAVIFFGLSTFGVSARFNLLAAGLLCLALAELISRYDLT